MRQLQIDAGNSRIKWRIIDQAQKQASESVECCSGWIASLAAHLRGVGPVAAVALSSVAGDSVEADLCGMLSTLGLPAPFIARTEPVFAGLTLAYRVGVDRWLAMLSAHHEMPGGEVLVVDCGTALTMDVVSGSGEHLGGYIIPGIGLMGRSLASNTAGIVDVGRGCVDVALGRTTSECIRNGIVATAVATVNRLLFLHPKATLFLTGGDAATIVPMLNHPDRQRLSRDLVLDGLTIAYKEGVGCVGQ